MEQKIVLSLATVPGGDQAGVVIDLSSGNSFPCEPRKDWQRHGLGKCLGCPKGRLGQSRLNGKEDEIQRLLGLKVSKSSIVKITGVDRSTLYLSRGLAL